jgi:hypothetical protein
MKLAAFAALAALGGAVGFASWDAIGIAAFGSAPGDSTTAVPVAVKGDRAPLAPVAATAVIDVSLFSPQMMLPVQEADPVVTGSLRTAAIQEMKKTVNLPRLDRDGVLTDANIAAIKSSLNLTPDQERHWAAVEAELREIARQHAGLKAENPEGKRPKAAQLADSAQRLYWAAGPLILSMREDQKQEIRRLARAMGLAQVAALI